MKTMKKIVSLLLVLTIAMGLSLTAFAAEHSINPLAVETNGVITVSGPQLKGKNVTIVRMFTGNIGADGATVGYTLESAWQDFFNQQLHKGVDENATSQEAYDYVSKLQSESTTTVGTSLIDFAKEAKANYKAHSTDFADLTEKQTAGDTNSVTFNNLTSGYYLVLPASGSTATNRVTDAMLVNVRDDAVVNINLKTEYPTVDKTVTPEGGHGTSAQIGDKVNFELTSKVPNMTDYTTYFFKFKDTMSKGLTLDQNTIKVTIDGQEVTMDNNYTVATSNGTDGETVLEITFTDLKKVPGAVPGAAIKVSYAATLNENAQVGTNPNTNKAALEYSNDPDNAQHGTSEPSITKTYTFDIQIHKYANSDMKTLLPGAVFELQDSTGKTIKLVKVSDTEYRVATAAEQATGVDTFVTVVTGNVVIKGMKAGKYQLVEKAAPDGYNPLTKPVGFEIQAQYEMDGSLSTGFPKYVVGNAEGTASNVINVQNKNGTFLPETGSIGTIGLTIVGAALVIGGIGFTSRKKKEQE